MNAPRQDAWNKEEDLLLANIVLSYIREGRTQLEAFREVAQRLRRTSAACGFRWNATVRKDYEQSIQEAKQNKKGKRAVFIATNQTDESFMSLDEAISILNKLKENQYQNEERQKLEQEIERLQNENQNLIKQLKPLKDAWTEMDKLAHSVKERPKIK